MKHTALTEQRAKEFAEGLVDKLNFNPQQDSELRPLFIKQLEAYLDSWIEAGFQLNKWSEWREKIERDLRDHTEPSIQGNPPQIVTILKASGDDESRDVTLDRVDASVQFAQFLAGPYSDKINKCKLCGQYFVNTSDREKVYCSRECATRDTAIKAVAKKRKADIEQKLARVRYAVDWVTALPDNKRQHIGDLKLFIAHRAKVTPEFLTQSFTRGRLDGLVIFDDIDGKESSSSSTTEPTTKKKGR